MHAVGLCRRAQRLFLADEELVYFQAVRI